jgi:hypothetical protein
MWDGIPQRMFERVVQFQLVVGAESLLGYFKQYCMYNIW